MVKARLSETTRLAFFFARLRSIVTDYIAKIRDSEMRAFAQESRLRDPRNFTKILRDPYF